MHPSRRLPIPLVRQASNFTCGVAALLSCLYYWQVYDGREDQLCALMGGVKKYEGVGPHQLAEVAMNLGLFACVRTDLTLDDLRAWLDDGVTAILFLQAWPDEDEPPHTDWSSVWEDGHCVVLVGMDDENLHFADPVILSGYVTLPIPELAARWHDHFRGERVNAAAIALRGKTPLTKWPAMAETRIA